MTSSAAHLSSESTLLNDGCEYREQLDLGSDGQTLLTYLAGRYDHSSEAEWKARIESGLVLIDSKPAQHDTILANRIGAYLASAALD